MFSLPRPTPATDTLMHVMHHVPRSPTLSLVLAPTSDYIFHLKHYPLSQAHNTMEALGGAASVIGAASLAIEVCKALKKVHNFWESVKEAPDGIARITVEVDLFMKWLAVTVNNYHRHGFDDGNPNYTAATDTLKLCLEIAYDMSSEVRDLDKRLSTGLFSRKWASVKFVFRKDKREKAVQQIERMKSLLLIVQTCYIG